MQDPKELKEARLAAGFKLREVGSHVSLDPSTIASYEGGRARPSPQAKSRWREGLTELLGERRRQIDRSLGELAKAEAAGNQAFESGSTHNL